MWAGSLGQTDPLSKAAPALADGLTVFVKKDVPDEIPSYEVPAAAFKDGKVWIVKLLVDAGLCSSNGEARRLIDGGGLTIDGERVSDKDFEFEPQDGTIIKAGKRKFIRLVVK